MSLFSSSAVTDASTAASAAQPDGTFSLVMIVAIFVVFYFMLIRPQNKRVKAQRDLVNKLEKGDEIVTSGGILAKVVNLDDNYIKASVADGVEINLQRSAVSTVLPKGTLKAL